MALSRTLKVRTTLAISSTIMLLGAVGSASGQAAPAARLLIDSVPGSGSGYTASFAAIPVRNAPAAPTFFAADGALYFRAGTSSARNDLIRTEGRPGSSTVVFSGVTSNPAILGSEQSQAVVFLAQPTTGPTGLYGTSAQYPAGTLLAAGATLPGMQYTWSNKEIPTLRGSALFVATSPTGPQVWITDGTPLGTKALTSMTGGQVLDIATTRSAAYMLVFEGGLNRVYATDGTPSGLWQIWSGTTRPSWGTSTAPLATSDSTLFFPVLSGSGTTIMTHDAIRGLNTNVTMPGSSTSIAFVWGTKDGNGIYFERSATVSSTSRKQLWHFSADPATSGLVIDFLPDTTLTQLAATNGLTLFGDSRGPYAQTPTLWITNGTPAGTFAMPGFMSSQSFDQSSSFGAMIHGSEFWFNSTSTTAGIEPTCLDLGTGQLSRFDVFNGTASSTPSQYTELGFAHETAFIARVNSFATIMLASQTSTPRSITSTLPYTGSQMGAIGNRLIFWASATGLGIEPHVVDLCPGDYDNNGALNSIDLFAYINDFMVGLPKTDMDGPGTAPTTSDLILYLNSWFTGC